jgi:hypothetical protein
MGFSPVFIILGLQFKNAIYSLFKKRAFTCCKALGPEWVNNFSSAHSREVNIEKKPNKGISTEGNYPLATKQASLHP